jgi:hypothetical protein
LVGDVHGCADELDALLAKIAHDAQRDVLVLVGDMVNKGPKSAEVGDQGSAGGAGGAGSSRRSSRELAA